MKKMASLKYTSLTLFAGLAMSTASYAAQTFTTDLIVQGSTCTGFDCASSESFGFDTLRLKENNLRIHFNDTSASASFPSNDWRISINDSSNGGDNYFGVEDSTAGRIPFRVEAGAPVHTLYVEADGDVGIKTNSPVVDIHIVEGNTPTLRLEQDGSDGFTPQAYDVAANESNFFIRDVTNGSKLFFRAKPGAPEDSLFIAADGDVGLGTDAPGNELHISDSGNVGIRMDSTDTDSNLRLSLSDGTGAGGLDEFRVVFIGAGAPAMAIEADGDTTVSGALVSGGLVGVGAGANAAAITPSVNAAAAQIYVDNADGDLKVIFPNGSIRTLATD